MSAKRRSVYCCNGHLQKLYTILWKEKSYACSQSTHSWATVDFVLRFEVLGSCTPTLRRGQIQFLLVPNGKELWGTGMWFPRRSTVNFMALSFELLC